MRPKIAFITGASRGIGYAIAEKFASEGYHLAVNSRNAVQLAGIAKRLSEIYHVSCYPVAGDVSDFAFIEQACKRIQNKLGNIEVLINNAGISHIGLLADMSLEEWNHVMDTNLTSVFGCCKFVVPQMLQKESGKIINISSVWGESGASCEVAYSAAKGGMNAFTKALAKELAPSNIQVNAIACGVIGTKMNFCFSEEECRSLKEEIPTGRFGTVEEVAELVITLAESSSYLTGQVIALDGGWR